MIECFAAVIDIGLRTGGGIGEGLVYPDPQESGMFYKKIFYNITFFIIVNVIVLNICFGIIIDTFAELRDAKKIKGTYFLKNYLILN